MHSFSSSCNLNIYVCGYNISPLEKLMKKKDYDEIISSPYKFYEKEISNFSFYTKNNDEYKYKFNDHYGLISGTMLGKSYNFCENKTRFRNQNYSYYSCIGGTMFENPYNFRENKRRFRNDNNNYFFRLIHALNLYLI